MLARRSHRGRVDDRLSLPAPFQHALDATVERLRAVLGGNLYSLVLYGSAARGELLPGVSDLNLLLVLEESNPEAHRAIAEALPRAVTIEPLVLGRRGLDRSLASFAVKFRSIRRSYRLLAGTDPLHGFNPDAAHLRFLAEQALRNLCLRLVHGFVVAGRRPWRYRRFVLGLLPGLITDLAEVLRCDGQEVPDGQAEALRVFRERLGVDVSILEELLALKARRRGISRAQAEAVHARLFHLLDSVLLQLETRWPRPTI